MLTGSRYRSAVQQHRLVAFFVLAYLFSWWAWIPYAWGKSPNPIASFGPFLAALVVLALTEGRRGVLGLLRRMVHWRIDLRWYAVALLVPIILTLAASVLNVALGAPPPSATAIAAWPNVLSTFVLVLLVPGLGGAWEEPGWRGYALPRLQAGRSALRSSLILAVLIAGWHLPLMVAGQVSYSDIVLILAAVIVVNSLFNSTGGSVLVVMVLHAMNNAVSGSFFSPMFSGADSSRQSWLLALVWGIAAVVVLLRSGPEHLSRQRTRVTIPDDRTPADGLAP
jgi:membrane protease YdiL (CAAX protease family)